MNRPTTPGNLTRVGSGSPASGLGQNGDIYLDELTGRHWEKLGGSWGLMFQPTLPTTKLVGQISTAQLPATIPAANLPTIPVANLPTNIPAANLAGFPNTVDVSLRGDGSWAETVQPLSWVTNGGATQAIPNASWTDVTMTSSTLSVGSAAFVSGINGISVQNGVYAVMGYISWAGNSAGSRILKISRYNSVAALQAVVEQQVKADGTGDPVLALGIFPVNANDYFSLAVYQTAGGTLGLVEATIIASRIGLWHT